MRYVWRCVLCQWLSLLCNVAFVWALAGIVGGALGAGLAAGAWPAAFAVCMTSIPPVSYTHLTLPTTSRV